MEMLQNSTSNLRFELKIEITKLNLSRAMNHKNTQLLLQELQFMQAIYAAN